MRPTITFLCFMIFIFLFLPLAARADMADLDRFGGSVHARVLGEDWAFPTLKTEISAQVRGDVATVVVRQVFENPTDQALNAQYLFPLNHDAAVYAMWMEVGSERLRAQIARRAEAKQRFEQARLEGRNASLLRQHRANVFTQDLANLMPGQPITVELHYTQSVPKVDGWYEMVIPLVVGPRFEPPPQTPRIEEAPDAVGDGAVDPLPAYPPVFGLSLPATIERERLSLRIDLDGGVPIESVSSTTHTLSFDTQTKRRWQIGLAQGRAVDNRDFVLRYKLGSARIETAALAQHDARGGFFSLLIEPPPTAPDASVLPREMVFLLDCSGSMHGAPMEASKVFMREALQHLRPGDRFRIIRFSDRATAFSSTPLPATPGNIARGLAYVAMLQGEGGTMMSRGIEQAFAPPVPAGAVRIVTFLTDGYIGNDAQILSLVRQRIGDARLYAFGVGAGVNRYLLDEISRLGRGFTRYLDPGSEDLHQAASELAARLQSPLLTDLQIDWGGLEVSEVYPQPLPDLFAGQSLRVYGRYVTAGAHEIAVTGLAHGRRARLPLSLQLPAQSRDGEAIPLVWARAAIRDAMASMGLPQADDAVLRERVTQLGLDFSLMTRWTSFVAVSESVVNAHPEHTVDTPLPLAQVAHVGPEAYPQQASPTGAAGPEPETWLGLLLGSFAFAWFARRRAR